MYIKVASASKLLQGGHCHDSYQRCSCAAYVEMKRGITCSMALPCYALLSTIRKYIKIRFFPAVDAAHPHDPICYKDKFERPRSEKNSISPACKFTAR